MFRISKYWLFQITGWVCFSFINIYVAILTGELDARVILMNIFVSLIGLGLSHLFRNAIRKYQLASLPTERLMPVIIAAIAILSIFYNILYYIGLYLVYHESVLKLKPSSFLGTFVAVFFLFSVWSIIYFAWTYIENNRRNLIERLRMESTMKDLALRTLRSNLQPHFIFNSLNSIRALIDEDPKLARAAITRISNILRKTISGQESTDTLENEMSLVEDYLALEKIRFEERLTFTKDIDPASLTVEVPTMMLQTLVENAIKHGISRLERGGKVHISASIQENFLLLEIINTGHLQEEGSAENSLGFGLSASRQRLHLLYDGHADLSIFEKDNEVHVVVKINTSQIPSL